MTGPMPDAIGLRLDQHVADRLTALVSGDGPVVVGVSGGVDSIVLLYAMVATGRDVVAAHVNYRLRGIESDGDERLVRTMCERLGVPCRIHRAPDAPSASVQAWARRIRYDWFERIAATTSSRAISVAHHADDQAESVLINIIRGTGLDGLRGMRPVRPVSRSSDVMLVRPLLDVYRSEIEAYARERGLSWRVDVSNESDRYLRSRVRRWLSDSSEPSRGSTSELADPYRLSEIAGRARATGERLSRLVRSLDCPDPSSIREGPLDLPTSVLSEVPPAVAGWIVNRILSEMDGSVPRNRDVVRAVLALLASQPGRRTELGDWAVWRMRDGLRFEKAGSEFGASGIEHAFHVGEPVELPRGRLESGFCAPPGPEEIRLPGNEALLDADLLGAELRIRPWKDGDRMQPLGMQGSRKVKDILTDRKVPPPEKSGVHVVVSGEDIVWIVGYDIDHRFRIRPETHAAARFKFLVC